MPVGTKATVKSVDPDELRALGRDDRPRQHVPPALPARRRRDRARSAACTGSWAGTGRSSPTPAASRSSRCATRCSRVDDDGVTFRSVYDGEAARFTPSRWREIQRRARLRHRDVPSTPFRLRTLRAPTLEDAVRRTTTLGRAPARRDRGAEDSSSSGSRRAAPTSSCAAARSRRSPSSTSMATRSAVSRSARTAT